MINPSRLCNDLFDDVELSNANLRGFTENFLVRVSGNNPAGIYTQLITDTTTKHTNFYGKITNELVKEAISQGLTKNTDESIAEVIAELSKLEGLVIYKFGKDGDTYQEFYPYGLSEYHQSNIDDLAPLLDRFVVAGTTHLTAVEMADVNTKTAKFKFDRNAQVTVFAEVDVLETGKHADRKQLTLQLTFDFLTIAANNIDNEDAFNDYFDPRYLPLTEADNSVPLTGKTRMGETATLDISGIAIKAESSLLLENNTATTLRWFFTNSPGNGPTGNFMDVGPNNSVVVKAGDINFSEENPVLSVQNIGGSDGDYRVKISV